MKALQHKEIIAKETSPKQSTPEAGLGKEKRKAKHGIRVATTICALALAGAGAWYWWQQNQHALPPGISKSNGRLEAEQVEIAAKLPGRIVAILAKEGDTVEAGQVLARMDTAQLQAQLQSEQAQVVVAEHQKVQAEANIVQQASNLTWAKQEFTRHSSLVTRGVESSEELDRVHNALKSAQAAYDTAVAGLEAAKATIQSHQASAAVYQSLIDDSTLVAPCRGRVQYKLAQVGEVLAAGGRVLTVLDLSDVYLTIFLPSSAAGQLMLGDDARVILDPFPQYVIPAKVSFIATEAQFTPKAVETAEEREKLMFRIKLSISPELLKQYSNEVKTGVRGIGYARTSPTANWPNYLTVKLP
jgi:HlyD family secretion protein